MNKKLKIIIFTTILFSNVLIIIASTAFILQGLYNF